MIFFIFSGDALLLPLERAPRERGANAEGENLSFGPKFILPFGILDLIDLNFLLVRLVRARKNQNILLIN